MYVVHVFMPEAEDFDATDPEQIGPLWDGIEAVLGSCRVLVHKRARVTRTIMLIEGEGLEPARTG